MATGGSSTHTVIINVEAQVEKAKQQITGLKTAFKDLKLPKGIDNQLEKSFGNLDGLFKKYQDQLNKGFNTRSDLTKFVQTGKLIEAEWEKVGKTISSITGKEVKFEINNKELLEFQSQLDSLIQKRSELVEKFNDKTINNTNLKVGKTLDNAQEIAGNTKAGQYIGLAKGALSTGDYENVIKYLNQAAKASEKFGKAKKEAFLPQGFDTFSNLLRTIINQFTSADGQIGKVNSKIGEVSSNINSINDNNLKKVNEILAEQTEGWTKQENAIHESTKAANDFAETTLERQNQVNNLERQIEGYFGLTQVLRKVINIARKAFQTVKELDAAMVETAVVTNFDVGDMWEMLPMYTEQANQLGSTIKDVYEAATLYYQQGLNQAQAMGLANETLKMARIGGLQAAEATDMMTAALRGFNMQINAMSAQRINDVYSQLAAITASDTRELGSAMERTASIANSAGMAFETTSAFLAQMIETTREAPENLGTAMKTIVARFQEMKEDPTKLIDSEGVAMDANRVDKALKTIGISLMDTNGQFRNLDEVFLEISSRWDGLTQTQQRYIATIAAGSRQQSRFIAMMQNHERVTELVEAANNSSGASQEQFNKTLEGMDAKLNKLKNAWDQFAMGLANNQIIKFGIDALTKVLTVVNKIIDVLGGHLPDPFGGIVKSVLTLTGVLSGLNIGKVLSKGVIRGSVEWWSGNSNKGLARNIFDSIKMNPKAGDMAKTGIVFKDQLRTAIETGKIVVSPNIQFSKKNLIPGSASSQLQAELDKEFTDIARKVKAKELGASEGADLFIRRANSTAALMEEDIDFSNSGKKIAEELENAGSELDAFDNKITRAGTGVRQFGQLLMGTPLQPFGVLLDKIGLSMELLGGSMTKLKTAFMTGAVSTTVMAGAEGAATTASFSLVGGLKAVGAAIWEAMGPFAPFIAALVALIAVTAALWAWSNKDAKALKNAQKAAGEASDAYSSAAQATSELRDNLEQLQELDTGFEGLVAGTAAFNEQLVKSNELIMELLEKYPMLYDYLSIDNNGRMKISDEGIEAVSDYQKEITSNAAAMNVIKNGEYQAQAIQKEINEKQNELNLLQYSHSATDEEKDRLKEEIQLLEKKKESQLQSAHLTGITTSLSDKELKNRQAINQIYSEQYETAEELAKSELSSMSKKDRYQMYADYYGYTYDGKKTLLDNEGNEVDVDYKTIKNAIPDIIVKTKFEADAESLDRIISQVNSSFEEGFKAEFDFGNPEDNEGFDTFFSDVLEKSADANENLIKALREDDTKLVELVGQMGPEQVAEILGEDKDLVEKHLNDYQDEVVALIEDNMEDIAQAQLERSADLAAMIGESRYGRRGDNRKKYNIEQELKSLTAAQQRIIQQTGSAIRDAVGRESMSVMVGGMLDIYESQSQADINNLQEMINGVNWDSPTERLLAYNRMINEGTDAVREMGEALLDSNDSANLITDAFGEMYTSDQFQDATEDIKDFVDASGNYTAAGILKMSKSVGLMEDLIKSGMITAGGMATALNAISGAGDLTYLDLNDNILKLMSAYSQLDTVIAETQQTIENFDPGIDTGAGEDFIKDQVKAWNEFYENGEYGNPQMEAIARLIVGTEEWEDAVKDAGGNMEKVYDRLYSKINLFDEGFYEAWSKMANGANDPKNLVTWKTNEKGESYIDLKLEGDIQTTDEVLTYLQDSLGITEEAAKMMLTDFKNYSWDLEQELSKNDFQAALKDATFFKDRIDQSGNVRITESEIKLIADSMGMESDEVVKEIKAAADDSGRILEVLDNIDDTTGKLSDNYAELNKEGGFDKEYLKQNYASTNPLVGGENVIDISAALAGLKNEGYGQDQVYGMLYQQMKDLNDEGLTFEYGGEILSLDDFPDLESFIERLTEIDETIEWKQIGEYIAEGMANYEAKTAKENQEQEQQQEPQAPPVGASGRSASEEKVIEYKYQVNKDQIDKAFNGAQKLNIDVEIANKDEVRKEAEKIVPSQEKLTVVFDPNTGLYKEVELGIENTTLDVETILYASDQVSATIEDIEAHDQEGITINFFENGLSGINSYLNTIKQKVLEIKASGNAYTGLNNSIPTSHVPLVGSLASGTIGGSMASGVKRGRVGPKNQGGLTLTGELGYEVAWLPSEGRSMILGVGGPQMVNLPKDAVVYNHEQSKDILRNKKTISAGSESAGSYSKKGGGSSGSSSGSSGSSSSSSGSGSSKSGSDKDKHLTINNWSIEEVIRFDIEKKIENYQNKVDNWMKTLDKALGKIGTKVGDVTSNINNQIDYLKSVKNQNDNLAASYQRSLNKLDTGNYKATISYDSGGESKQEDINLSSYIYKDKWGNYQIDQNKIKQAGSIDRQEAIFKAVEGALSPLVSGLLSAQNAAREAEEAINDLEKKVYDTFYGWKNELTRIYNLTQQIANYTSMTDRFNAQIDLEYARLNAGYGTIGGKTDATLKNLINASSRYNETTKKQIQASYQLITAREKEIDNALSSIDELRNLNRMKEKYGANSGEAAAAQEEYTAAKLMTDYIKGFTKYDDGHIEYDIDWSQIEADRQEGKISEATYNALKQKFDELGSAATDYNNALQDTTSLLASVYEQLAEYRQTIAEFEDTLLKHLANNLQKQIDNASKLNESLKKALKNLLDEVKRKLSERRQAEDNAKTEDDIAKKQQRLALLRANTSGGNQVEIAQLEKEIGDAQQSYQRTLEDQLLNKLQQQGDLAAKQREQQIEIMKTQLELSSNTNKAIVEMWLNDPIKYKDEIEAAWKEANNYDDKGQVGQKILNGQFEKEYGSLLTAIVESGEYNPQEVAKIAGIENLNDTTIEMARSLETVRGDLNKILKFVTKDNIEASPKTLEQLQADNYDVATIKKMSGFENKTVSDFKKAGFTYSQIKQGGFTLQNFLDSGVKDAKDLRSAGFSAKQLYDKGYGYEKLKAAGYGLKDFKAVGWGVNFLKNRGHTLADLKAVGFTYDQLVKGGFKKADVDKIFGKTDSSTGGSGKTYAEHGGTLPSDWPGSFTYDYTKKIQGFLRAIGLYKDKIDGSYGPNTTAATKAFQKKVGLAQDGLFGSDTLKKARVYKYKKGGLVPFTGPAWLDGSKAKPELVLNATDTKNFVQLKDILASVMKGGAFDAPAAAAGDVTYEVNINVDHISNDYDVEKMANKIKKIIVQDSSYRNVTTVRRLR